MPKNLRCDQQAHSIPHSHLGADHLPVTKRSIAMAVSQEKERNVKESVGLNSGFEQPLDPLVPPRPVARAVQRAKNLVQIKQALCKKNF